MRVFIDYHKPDIIALTETWGRPALTDSLLTPGGYCLFRKDRASRLGGGVLLFVREELMPFQINVPNDVFEDNVFCCIQVNQDTTLLVGCFYRSPNSSALNNDMLKTLFDSVGQVQHDLLIIVGDFNCPDINWNTMTCASSSQFLLDSVLDNFLTQMVNKPTRDDHILDLVFVNDPTFISDVKVTEKFPGSDHCIVECTLILNGPLMHKENSARHQFRFSRANWDLYRALIQSTTWDDFVSTVDAGIDPLWEKMKAYILNAATAAIPCSYPTKKIKGAPITGAVRKAFRHRKKILRSLKGSKSSLSEEIREQAEISLRTAIDNSRKDYERKIARESTLNPKRFWSHVREAYASKPVITSVSDAKGELVNGDQTIANIFNNSFASVFTKENPKESVQILLPRTETQLNNFTLSLNSISSAIKAMPTHSSPGPDEIPNILLKEGGSHLIELIYRFFSIIQTEGHLPSEWKTAVVVPIHKKGSRTEAKNYRPISLTCTMCKLFERLLKDSILAYLLDNNLLANSQHGFVPNRSCFSALLTFFEKVTSDIDNKDSVDVVYLDFSKAFDTVPHNRLIAKLKSFGIGGRVLDLLISFLSDRSQIVTIRNSLSSSLPVSSGVPQGSVIGPLLFILYVDDIDQGIKSNILKFADDVKLYLNLDTNDLGSPGVNLIQSDLDKIIQWCSIWLLQLNPIKCCCLHFGAKNPKNTYSLGNAMVANIKEITDLGIAYTSDLKPSTQCLRAAARAHRMLSIIKLAFKHLDVRTITVLYKTLVRPLLDYCCVIWCPFYVKDIEVLEKVQRRFTRILPTYRHLQYEDRLTVYNLPSLYARRLAFDLITVYKIINQII